MKPIYVTQNDTGLRIKHWMLDEKGILILQVNKSKYRKQMYISKVFYIVKQTNCLCLWSGICVDYVGSRVGFESGNYKKMVFFSSLIKTLPRKMPDL